MSHSAKHWDQVYASKADAALTWHQDDPGEALAAIRAQARPGDPILDVGGGTARLVDRLVDAGFGPVTVLDLSGEAIAKGRARLGPLGDAVNWVAGDITSWIPDQPYAFWHDRAVFHFLTAREDRAAYVKTLLAALEPGGTAMISTFANGGPEKCSGLAVCRYASKELIAEIDLYAPGVFEPLDQRRHDHVTPTGNVQKFQTTVLRRRWN